MTIRKGTIQMTRLKTNLNFCLGLGTLLLLAGCASEPKEFEYKNLTEEVEAIKADGGIYKVGNPYTVMGQSYTPREDYGYVETGMASWYGDDFHNKRTANGETYDMRAVTAAHRTLPLPSIVRVTNLENGRSIIARVNDRGPYVKNRIIDLSEKGAELLGYKNKGNNQSQSRSFGARKPRHKGSHAFPVQLLRDLRQPDHTLFQHADGNGCGTRRRNCRGKTGRQAGKVRNQHITTTPAA